jgi:hypothetical protein
LSDARNLLAGNQALGAFYFDVAQIAAPANPAAGTRRLFVDSADGKLKVRTSAGTSVSLEEQGGAGTPASTVVGETTFGLASAVGTGTDYARNDHTHGSPSLGTTSATACAGNDARLSDARTPLSHTHVAGDLPDLDGITMPNASVQFNQQQALQFRVENRTTDPSAPLAGECWLRTDL